MIEAARGALEKALQTALKAIDGTFGNDVYPVRAPAKAGDTYCVFFWAGGGEIQDVMTRNIHEFIYSVKCVSPDLSSAALGQAQIIDALRNKGTQQVTAAQLAAGVVPLDGRDDWDIVTVFGDQEIGDPGAYAEVKDFYHRGNQFRIRMEATDG